MGENLGCPFCSECEDVEYDPDLECIVCNCCGAQGPTGGNSASSWNEWNDRDTD